ncbi:MAG: hypothetical protein IPN95_05860 [Bacteroidetes bacterium]|nr:hypothetical protein [Bacteroidota bacterium]
MIVGCTDKIGCRHRARVAQQTPSAVVLPDGTRWSLHQNLTRSSGGHFSHRPVGVNPGEARIHTRQGIQPNVACNMEFLQWRGGTDAYVLRK